MSRWKIERRRGACAACERAFEDGERHRSALLLSCDVPARRDLCLDCWQARTESGADPSELLELGAEEEAPAEAPEASAVAGDATDGATTPAGEAADGTPEDASPAADPAPEGGDAPTEGSNDGATRTAGGVEIFWWTTVHRAAPQKSVQMDLETLERLFLELEGRAEQRLRELRYVVCLLLMRKRRVKVEKVTRSSEGEFFVVRRPRQEEHIQVQVFDFTPERMEEVRHELQAIFDGAEDADGALLPELDPDAPRNEDGEAAPEGGEADADGEADGSVVAGDPDDAEGSDAGDPALSREA